MRFRRAFAFVLFMPATFLLHPHHGGALAFGFRDTFSIQPLVDCTPNLLTLGNTACFFDRTQTLALPLIDEKGVSGSCRHAGNYTGIPIHTSKTPAARNFTFTRPVLAESSVGHVAPEARPGLDASGLKVEAIEVAPSPGG